MTSATRDTRSQELLHDRQPEPTSAARASAGWPGERAESPQSPTRESRPAGQTACCGIDSELIIELL